MIDFYDADDFYDEDYDDEDDSEYDKDYYWIKP